MENMEDFELSELEDCDYIDENINNFDLFEGFLTLTLNHAYVPDIDKRDIIVQYFRSYFIITLNSISFFAFIFNA